MASRTWLAVALCCLVWYGYLQWFAPKPVPETGTVAADGQTPVSTSPDAASAIPASPYFRNPLTILASPSISSGDLLVSFSDPGGRISQAEATKYNKTVEAKSGFITMVSPQISTFDLGTLFSEPSLEELSRGTYERHDDNGGVHYKKTVAGVTVAKDYKLNDGNYTIDATYTLTFPTDQKRLDWGYLAIPIGGHKLEHEARDPLRSWEVVAYQNDSIKRTSAEKLDDGEKVLQGNTSWLAFGNKFFSSVVMNTSGGLNPDIVFIKSNEFTGGYLRYPLKLKEGQTDLTIKNKLYLGPKSKPELSKYPGLKELIDFGMFKVLAYPLLELLRLFFSLIPNYGVAIILLTIFVRVVFYPLSVKSARSMKAMQKLQPQIAALKERYKDDPQKFNVEQMALFKTHKVNPAGGCLPMLVQFPVFFALYAVLGNSIELFQAQFLWIHDLSAKDPFYIFPVLSGIAMFAQQKLTPTAGMDPMQAKMMLLMPVIITFAVISLPSGLTLYIFLSTLLGILQQVIMNKEPGTKTVPVIASPARK